MPAIDNTGEPLPDVVDVAVLAELMVEYQKLQAETAAWVNLATALTRANGGTIVVTKAELEAIEGCVIRSQQDDTTGSVTLTVRREASIVQAEGEPQPARILRVKPRGT